MGTERLYLLFPVSGFQGTNWFAYGGLTSCVWFSSAPGLFVHKRMLQNQDHGELRAIGDPRRERIS